MRPPPPPDPPPVPVPPAKPFDWEAFFGVKLFAWLGGFVLFLGIVFLVKYSFENNLVTPAMRVAIGTVVGIGLVATGWFTATRNYRVSGQSLCATGVLVLYGNIFAAHVFYHLIPIGAAFASMALVTAAAFFLAVRMNAQVIVILGLLGGFLTPVLLSTGVDNPAALFGYIAVLNLGIAAVSLRKRWDYLVLLAAVGTIVMEFAWAGKFFDVSKADIAFAVFIGFEAQFLAVYAAARRIHEGRARWTMGAAIAVSLAALLWGFCLLTYQVIAVRPGFLFTYVFLAEAGLLALALPKPRSALLAPIGGTIVFLFFAIWTGNYLSYASFFGGPSVATSCFPFFTPDLRFGRAPRNPRRSSRASRAFVPLLPLVLVWFCVAKNQTSLRCLVGGSVSRFRRHQRCASPPFRFSPSRRGRPYFFLGLSLDSDRTIDDRSSAASSLSPAASGAFSVRSRCFAARRFFPDSLQAARIYSRARRFAPLRADHRGDGETHRPLARRLTSSPRLFFA